MSGPDAGKWGRFDQETVTVGRAWSNDFVLQDRFVSNKHGYFTRSSAEQSYTYRDLGSRHGSLAVVDERSGLRLHRDEAHQSVSIARGGEIQVGSSVIRLNVELEGAPIALDEISADSLGIDLSGALPTQHERFITAIHEPQAALDRRMTGKDPRLQILYRLAGQLNGLNRLDEILDMVGEATFEAFPASDFFSVHLLGEEGLTPFVARLRKTGDQVPPDEASLVSQSLLQKVVETREAVLFVRDSMGRDLTRSILEAQIYASLCAPLVGQRALLGVVQVDTRRSRSLFTREDLDLFSIFASSVAFALERARLTENIYRMFEGFVAASVKAIEARDPMTAGHSERVTQYTMALARAVNAADEGPFAETHFGENQLRELRYAALLHDFGKVGVREAVLMKYARISDEQMELIQLRFETFKAARWRRASQALFATLQSEGRGPREDELEALEAETSAFSAELDELSAFLDRTRHQGRLSDDDLAQIAALSQREAARWDGQAARFLTEDETVNLSIRSGTLNDVEFADVRAHAALSEDYLDSIPWSEDLQQIPSIAGAHHEKLDGSGYPRGLTAESLEIRVRMMTVADIFDAVTAWDRPYRRAATVEEALTLLRGEAEAGKLDSDLVELFAADVVPTMSKALRARDAERVALVHATEGPLALSHPAHPASAERDASADADQASS